MLLTRGSISYSVASTSELAHVPVYRASSIRRRCPVRCASVMEDAVEPMLAPLELVEPAHTAAPVRQVPVASSGLPLPALAAGFLLAAGAVLKVLQIRKRNREMAMDGRYVDPMADALKKYKKSQMEELSPDAIAAARMRRSRERANFRVDLDDVELPPNHPFATRAPVSKEEEEAVQERLQVRRRPRGMPPSSGAPPSGPGSSDGRAAESARTGPASRRRPS